MPEAFTKSLFAGEPLAIKGIIIFTLIVSFGAFLIKIFSKMAFSSLHLSRDAEERAQLTLVYLALVKKGEIKDDTDRKLILQSIFSRADTGLLGGDSSPTMPGITEVLKSIPK